MIELRKCVAPLCFLSVSTLLKRKTDEPPASHLGDCANRNPQPEEESANLSRRVVILWMLHLLRDPQTCSLRKEDSRVPDEAD